MSQVSFNPGNRLIQESSLLHANQNKERNASNWKVYAAAGTAIALCGLVATRALRGNVPCPVATCPPAATCPLVVPTTCPPAVTCPLVVPTTCPPAVTCPEQKEPSLHELSLKIYSKLSGELTEEDVNYGKDFLNAAHICDREDAGPMECLGSAFDFTVRMKEMREIFDKTGPEQIAALAFSEGITFSSFSSDEKTGIIKAAYEAYCKEKGLNFEEFEKNLRGEIYAYEGLEEFIAEAKEANQYPYV